MEEVLLTGPGGDALTPRGVLTFDLSEIKETLKWPFLEFLRGKLIFGVEFLTEAQTGFPRLRVPFRRSSSAAR